MAEGTKNYYFRLNLDDEEERKISKILDRQKNRTAFIRNAILRTISDEKKDSALEEKIGELIEQSTRQLIQEIRQVKSEENDWEKIKM